MDCIFQSLSVAPEGLTVGQMAGIGAGVGAAGIVVLGGISSGIYIYKSKMIGIINSMIQLLFGNNNQCSH